MTYNFFLKRIVTLADERRLFEGACFAAQHPLRRLEENCVTTALRPISSNKKPYASPRLAIYGHIKELTQTTGIHGADDGAHGTTKTG